MTPRQALDTLLNRTYRESARARILPLYEHDSLDGVRKRLGSVPPEVDELLARGAGIEIGYSEIRWDGNMSGQYIDALPVCHPVMEDGCGNFWMVDVDPQTGIWRGVYYVSHDPPVFVHQAASFSEFMLQFGDECESETGTLLTKVHDSASRAIWAGAGHVKGGKDFASSSDPMIRQILQHFGDDCWISDLRGAEPGHGFAWAEGREPFTIHRPTPEPLFVLVR